MFIKWSLFIFAFIIFVNTYLHSVVYIELQSRVEFCFLCFRIYATDISTLLNVYIYFFYRNLLVVLPFYRLVKKIRKKRKRRIKIRQDKKSLSMVMHLFYSFNLIDVLMICFFVFLGNETSPNDTLNTSDEKSPNIGTRKVIIKFWLLISCCVFLKRSFDWVRIFPS